MSVDLTVKQAQARAWMVWAAQVMGLVTLATVLIALTVLGERDKETPEFPFFLLSLGALFTALPAGLFIRGQVFKRHWVGEVVTPAGYLQGNLIAWACCEGVALMSLVFVLVSGELFPTVISAGVAGGLLLALWPNGRAMSPLDRHKQERG